MRKSILAIIALIYSFLGVNMHFAAADAWTQKTDFGGSARIGANGFSIGTKGYIGTGWPDLKDFWEYDSDGDTWSQKADFAGSGRYCAAGFSISNKGYIVAGYAYGYMQDFWEYDPVENKWTQKADFGGAARYGAAAFIIGSKGYAGAGLVNSTRLSDFWEYDPTVGPNGTWTQKTDVGGTAINVSFTIGNKGYVGLGTTGYLRGTKEFWEYEPTCYPTPVKVSSNYFDAVQTAYNSAASSSTVQIQNHLFTEDLSLNRDITTILDGGYICQYTTNTGYSTIDVTMTISKGTVTIKNLIIK